MDIVRRNIEALRGSVVVTSERGSGTTFTIRLPLTVAVIDGFAVVVDDETYVIPVDTIIECTEMPASAEDALCGVLNVRGEPLPFFRIRHLFGVGYEKPARENVVIVQHGHRRAGIVVDRLLGSSPIVMKPLTGLLRDVPGVAGSSVLGNGRVALILDTPTILRGVAGTAAAQQGSYR